MNEPPLQLTGNLGGSDLLHVLEVAAARRAYCTIQIIGTASSGGLHLANGEIIVPHAADAERRRASLHQIFALINAAEFETGTFRLVPLTNAANADSMPKATVSAAIAGARQARGDATPPVAAAPPRPAASAPSPTPPTTVDRPPSTAPTGAPPLARPPVFADTPTVPDRTPARPVRTSQLRRLLQQGGSIDELLPTEPTQEFEPLEPQRADALKSLIATLVVPDSPDATSLRR